MRRGARRLIVAMWLLFAASLVAAQSGQERFLTNLALLDRLTSDAVEEVLDGLDLPTGEPILLTAQGYHEGDEFVADAFARALARRGFAVRKLTETGAMTAEKTETPSTKTGTPDSPAARAQALVEQEQARARQEAEDLFGDDSIEADADSLLWADADSLESDDSFAEPQGELTPIEDRAEDVVTSDQEDRAAQAKDEHPAEATVSRKVYPEGPILEFKLLEFGVSYPNVYRPILFLGRTSVGRLAGVYLQGSHILGPEGTILQVATGQSHWQDRLSGSSRSLAEGASYPFRAPEIPPSRLGRYVEPVVVVGIIGSLVYLFYQNQN